MCAVNMHSQWTYTSFCLCRKLQPSSDKSNNLYSRVGQFLLKSPFIPSKFLYLYIRLRPLLHSCFSSKLRNHTITPVPKCKFVSLLVKPEKTAIGFFTKSVKIGESVTIACASDGFPEPRFTIFHNDTKIVSTKKTHTLIKVKWDDAGMYKCFTCNEWGNDSAFANLTIKGMTDARFVDIYICFRSFGINKNFRKRLYISYQYCNASNVIRIVIITMTWRRGCSTYLATVKYVIILILTCVRHNFRKQAYQALLLKLFITLQRQTNLQC